MNVLNVGYDRWKFYYKCGKKLNTMQKKFCMKILTVIETSSKNRNEFTQL